MQNSTFSQLCPVKKRKYQNLELQASVSLYFAHSPLLGRPFLRVLIAAENICKGGDNIAQ